MIDNPAVGFATSMIPPPQPELVMTDVAWSKRLGQLARAIGTDQFYERLLTLYGSLIGHDSAWIIRYSRVAPPEVRFTRDVPQHVVDIYRATFFSVDPFYDFWMAGTRPGVVLLNEVLGPGNDPYREIFQIKARIVDEMAMFFPVIGHSGLALFLERSGVPFSPEDKARAKLIFPALEGLHRAHVGRLFYELRYRTDKDDRSLIPAPALIVDRCGATAYTSPGWRDAERQLPELRGIVADWIGSTRRVHTPLAIGTDYEVRIEAFDRDFPLAPEGCMLVLEPRREAMPDLGSRLDGALQGIPGASGLTARERDILSLVVRGKTTGEIAQTLHISKGTIKNHRLRMYRKLNVTSERAMVGMLMPLLDSAHSAHSTNTSPPALLQAAGQNTRRTSKSR